jgi:tRNA(Arg) A34 adenosine deaminase TadA
VCARERQQEERWRDEQDLGFLRLAVDWARRALEEGDEPFGSVLVSAEGEALLADHNRVLTATPPATRSSRSRGAAQHLAPEERRSATVYTSGEHCAMCSAAHAWAGLGRIVFATTSVSQTAAWKTELGSPPARVRPLAITDVTTGIQADGPVPEAGRRGAGAARAPPRCRPVRNFLTDQRRQSDNRPGLLRRFWS